MALVEQQQQQQQPLSDPSMAFGITSQPSQPALGVLDIDSNRHSVLANVQTLAPSPVQQEEITTNNDLQEETITSNGLQEDTMTSNELQDVTEAARDAGPTEPSTQSVEDVVNEVSAQPIEKLANEVSTEGKRSSKRISFEDFIDLNDILFEWADSYDNKDWKRLEGILAPLMIVDYSIVGHERIEDLPAADFIGMMSSADFLGDPLVKTQHLMGARKFEYISDNEVLGSHQIRAAHQRYCADGITVENRGHGHAFIKHWYIKIDGMWKLKGLCPKI